MESIVFAIEWSVKALRKLVREKRKLTLKNRKKNSGILIFLSDKIGTTVLLDSMEDKSKITTLLTKSPICMISEAFHLDLQGIMLVNIRSNLLILHPVA